MAPFVQLITVLNGTKADGSPSVLQADVNVRGPITRTVGLVGDRLVLTLKRASIPGEWDLSKDFKLSIIDGVNVVTLGGYRLLRRAPGTWGEQLLLPGTVEPEDDVFVLVTKTQLLRDGRSGRVTAGTLNRVDELGIVDTTHADYKSNQELVDILLDAIGIAHDPAPVGLDLSVDGIATISPPGPLDWSNANALFELEGVLARLGWTATLKNDGSKITVHSLLRAGEEMPALPLTVTKNAEPYELDSSPGVRGSKYLVTSGRTKTMILTERNLADASVGPHRALEWVAFDSRSGKWLNATEWDTAYMGEVVPGSITRFRQGPVGDGGNATTRGAEDFNRLFTALRVSQSEIDQIGQFVMPIGEFQTPDGKPLAGAMAVGFGLACIDQGNGQLLNVPPDAIEVAVPARIDGVRPIPGQGVFVLPREWYFVRMAPGPKGVFGDAQALTADQLSIVFAHEANTGDPAIDMFIAGFEVSDLTGTLTATQMLEADAIAALTDPDVIKLEAPFLRRVMTWELHATDPVAVDGGSLDTAFVAIAKELVLARAAGALAESGSITLKGLYNLEPGTSHSGISSVTWDVDGLRTIVQINEHEMPRSFFDAQQRAAARSIAAGTSRVTLGGSSVSLADVRNGSAPEAGGGAGSVHAESKSASRGNERVSKSAHMVKHPGATPAEGWPAHKEVNRLFAKITGATALPNNRWKYNWSEVRLDVGGTAVTAGRTQLNSGPAYNIAEAFNTATGVQGHGVDVDNLPGTFATQPIRGDRVVELIGPFYDATESFWVFSATNAVDGGCEAAA